MNTDKANVTSKVGGTDFGIVPWSTNERQNRRTLIDIADEFGVVVSARHPVTDEVLMTVAPTPF